MSWRDVRCLSNALLVYVPHVSSAKVLQLTGGVSSTARLPTGSSQIRREGAQRSCGRVSFQRIISGLRQFECAFSHRRHKDFGQITR